MGERRSLVEGIKPPAPAVDPDRAREFVYGSDVKEKGEPNGASSTTPILARSPFSTRIRTDFTAALKRASLERQLKGQEPYTLQDILEQAIEPWLKSNGYLS